jgi:hypothetical protein
MNYLSTHAHASMVFPQPFPHSHLYFSGMTCALAGLIHISPEVDLAKQLTEFKSQTSTHHVQNLKCASNTRPTYPYSPTDPCSVIHIRDPRSAEQDSAVPGIRRASTSPSRPTRLVKP